MVHLRLDQKVRRKRSPENPNIFIVLILNDVLLENSRIFDFSPRRAPGAPPAPALASGNVCKVYMFGFSHSLVLIVFVCVQ